MDDWTWREKVAGWFHHIGYKFSPGVCQEVLIRDGDGVEIFDITFEGGFVATGPRHPYTAHSREYADDDDEVGTVTDWNDDE